MDQQRVNQYFALIDRLLKCSSGQETQILAAHIYLWDADLIETMQVVATTLADRGDAVRSGWLHRIAAQLNTRLHSYHTLVEVLLNQPRQDQQATLDADRTLVDAGLMVTMEQIAETLLAQGNQQDATWLKTCAAQIRNALNQLQQK